MRSSEAPGQEVRCAGHTRVVRAAERRLPDCDAPGELPALHFLDVAATSVGILECRRLQLPDGRFVERRRPLPVRLGERSEQHIAEVITALPRADQEQPFLSF